MVIPDPTEEIKAIRHRMGAGFNFDLDRIVEDIKHRQEKSGRICILLPPKKTVVKGGQSPEPAIGLFPFGLTAQTNG